MSNKDRNVITIELFEWLSTKIYYCHQAFIGTFMFFTLQHDLRDSSVDWSVKFVQYFCLWPNTCKTIDIPKAV